MGQVLVFSFSGIESELIKQKILSEIHDVVVQTVNTESEMMRFLILNSVGIIVLNLDSWSEQKIQLTKDLRALGNSSAIVILAPQVNYLALKRMERMYKTTVIQKPVRKNDLIGVIRKYLNDQMVQQRMAERFKTDNPSVVECFGNLSKTPSRMLNLSRTGAYLECHETPKFKVGDFVRVDVELNELKKIRSVNAKVIWISPLRTMKGGYGAGIHFI